MPLYHVKLYELIVSSNIIQPRGECPFLLFLVVDPTVPVLPALPADDDGTPPATAGSNSSNRGLFSMLEFAG